MHILIIEDEMEIAEGISTILESEGYQATVALDGKTGFDDEAEYNQLDVYVSFVRKKLRFVESRASVKTANGIGYSLEDCE